MSNSYTPKNTPMPDIQHALKCEKRFFCPAGVVSVISVFRYSVSTNDKVDKVDKPA